MKNNRIPNFIHHGTKVYKRVKIDIFDFSSHFGNLSHIHMRIPLNATYLRTLEKFLSSLIVYNNFTTENSKKSQNLHLKNDVLQFFGTFTVILDCYKFFNFSEHFECFWIVTLPKAALLSLLVRLWTFRALYSKKTRKVCKSERKSTKTRTFWNFWD